MIEDMKKCMYFFILVSVYNCHAMYRTMYAEMYPQRVAYKTQVHMPTKSECNLKALKKFHKIRNLKPIQEEPRSTFLARICRMLSGIHA